MNAPKFKLSMTSVSILRKTNSYKALEKNSLQKGVQEDQKKAMVKTLILILKLQICQEFQDTLTV